MNAPTLRRFTFIITLLLATSHCSAAQAWNAKGHMVIARMTWLKLTPTERQKVFGILKEHPHYQEYLSKDRPNNIDEQQWAFLRASTWSDWVRDHYRDDYHHGDWHYINLPYVPLQSDINPADHVPAAPNVVTQIPVCREKVRNASGEERAVYLCWLLHLVGDVHQPLHCTALFSGDFPTGDKGGNLSLVKVNGGRVKLHGFWDGLLGRSTSLSSIGGAVSEIEQMIQQAADLIAADLQNNKTAKSWAEEGLANTRKYVYLGGKLKPANDQNNPGDDQIPAVPPDYASKARSVANLSAAKAGSRLLSLLQGLLDE